AHGGAEHDLGALEALPLSVGGHAAYNVANLAAAALAAAALGIPPAAIAAAFARFGAAPGDNPGRLMRYERGGVHVLLDYAHNPDGLRGLLGVASHLRGRGRLALLLGHAGNRSDADIAAVAGVAAGFHPQLVVIKETEAHLRGRAPGEVPRILHAALRAAGLPESALEERPTELEAARRALAWARPGDVVALLVHGLEARAAVLALLEGAEPAAG
ncbi:MAG: Mur ligase, partial [Proteobacteria bacterium]|nr:Mur ligase [Pseudomonadota bacterium]